MAQTKVKTELIDGSLGVDWQSTIQISNFAAAAGKGYFVNTTSGAITVTLPSNPSLGDEISFVDYTGTFATNSLTFNPNGNKIRGGTSTRVINANNKAVKLVFTDSTEGWVIASSASDGDLAMPSYSLETLIVAGGGSSSQGDGNGGGGAGGLLTGTIANQTSGVQYTISIGAGGATVNGGNQTLGNDGNDSFIAIAGGTTHTANGGGKGGGGSTIGGGGAGGSGGGGGGANINGTNTTGGASNQTASSPLTGYGNPGGNGGGSNDYIGAGGGGAGAAGGVPSGSYPYIQAGHGGIGLASTIITTTQAQNESVGEVDSGSVYFAGGGGGGAHTAAHVGLGGKGGGADGKASGNGNPGDPNTGGGGAGPKMGSSGTGGAGGSGVVILKFPTSSFSQTTTGSPSQLTDGSGNTILIFKGSGTYTT